MLQNIARIYLHIHKERGGVGHHSFIDSHMNSSTPRPAALIYNLNFT